MFIYYDESILSYVSSIRDYFGLKSSYKPNQKFSNLLNKEKPNKVFLVLVDGMGANLVERYLDEKSFLRKNMFYKVQTVFPTTTTAALTSIQNGKGPNENGWLAWIQYLKDIDEFIVPFQNKGYYNEKPYGDGFFKERVPVVTTTEELNNIGIKASDVFPDYSKKEHYAFNEFIDKIIEKNKTDVRYSFCYFDGYDSVMHKEGVSSKNAINMLHNINDEFVRLSNNISDDTMIVIVADHGQIDVEDTIILKGTKFEKYLKRYTYLDPRAIGLDIKDEYRDEFEKEFVNEFEHDYILLNKKQIIDTRMFGYNENHNMFESMLPDYIAIGKTNKIMYTVDPPHPFKGHHTGIHDDEVYVPIIVYKKNKQ